ncbi:hypothetical protein AOLI_G00054930 [Acnodon oligacanthus]
MGQCVTKCKNPTSSLGSKSGEKDAGKSHKKGGGGGGGGGTGGHKDESKFPADVNGTKSPEVTVETSVAPPLSSGDVRREEPDQEGEGLSLARIEEMFMRYKDEHEDAILEEGMERFCNDLHVDPAEFKVLVLAWKFQAATMCKFTRREFVEGCRAIQADSLQGICQRFSCLLTSPAARRASRTFTVSPSSSGWTRTRASARCSAPSPSPCGGSSSRWTRPPSWSAGSTSCRRTRAACAGSRATPGTCS